MLAHQRILLLAVGRRLRADYDATAEAIPPRLAELVNQLERPIDSPPLPRKRSSRGEGRCRLVGGSIRNLHCADPHALPCNAQRFFWRECGPLGAALWGSSGGCESAG